MEKLPETQKELYVLMFSPTRGKKLQKEVDANLLANNAATVKNPLSELTRTKKDWEKSAD